MTSVFGWLDGDDAHRQQMLEVVKLFQDQSSVDELGIGSVRDAFSDALFPGTSVLHTRARYLLFIAWLLKDTARHGWSTERSLTELRGREVKLIRALLKGGETRGVIGSHAQEKLKSMPSAAYWAALLRFGIRRWDVSIQGHLRATAQGSRRVVEVTSEDDASSHSDLGLHGSLPPMPEDLLTTATFDLTADEADYLKGVFARTRGNTLLSWLAIHGQNATVDWIWEHPQLSDFPSHLQETIDHGRRFHHASHGAALLYNLMLSELNDSEDLEATYREDLDEWRADLQAHQVFDGWDLDEFWVCVRRLNPRLRPPTEAFLSQWFRLVQDDKAESPEARTLIQNREVRLKGNRSRLLNAGARENWTGGSGLVRLDYRWTVASRFLEDVYAGLEAS